MMPDNGDFEDEQDTNSAACGFCGSVLAKIQRNRAGRVNCEFHHCHAIDVVLYSLNGTNNPRCQLSV